MMADIERRAGASALGRSRAEWQPRRILCACNCGIEVQVAEGNIMADIHLQVRPGGDAFLLAAMLAVLVQEDLLDHGFLGSHAENHDPVVAAVRDVDARLADHACATPDRG